MPIQTKGASTGEGGTLISIGGHEDKAHDRLLLSTIADQVTDGALVVATIASNQPRELWTEYRPIFRALGVRDVRHLHLDSRDQALEADRIAVLDDVTTVFFTGGDQLKLTSQLGDTPIFSRVQEIFEGGGCIAGTSAGASVVCETMMVTGEQSASPRVRDALRMAPGFGFIQGVMIDQHFAERGRIGRLIGAVAQNPRILGIGIDEDTAIICRDRQFTVLGSGGVYIVDASSVSHSNLIEEDSDRTLSVFDVRLHLLNMGDAFDLETRAPIAGSAEDAEREVSTAK